MVKTLHLIQIISSIVLIILILIQRTQGDMGSSFGGENSSFSKTRRGAERFLFLITVATAVVFVGSSITVILL